MCKVKFLVNLRLRSRISCKNHDVKIKELNRHVKVTSNKWKFKARKRSIAARTTIEEFIGMLSWHKHRTNAFSTYFMRRWNCHNSYAICKAQWFEHEKRSAWIFRILIWARTNQLKNCNNKKIWKKTIQTHGAAQTNDCNSILVLVLFFLDAYAVSRFTHS